MQQEMIFALNSIISAVLSIFVSPYTIGILVIFGVVLFFVSRTIAEYELEKGLFEKKPEKPKNMNPVLSDISQL